MAKLYGKDTSKYDDIDVDDLLSKLTEEELEQLQLELIDPDDPLIPPSERCSYKTDKTPTGPYDRKKLLDFLETKAKEEKDWEEAKPYKKEIRGKVWKPKEEKIKLHDDEETETEWDEVLKNASEKELVDLAAILGFHGMLNQVQYHKAFVSGDADDDDEDEESGKGFQGIAKHQEFRLFDEDAVNNLDVDKALEQLRKNDPELKELNLNNIKNISIDRLCEIGDLLKTNTNLEKLFMANTRATEKVARVIAGSLSENTTLKSLNIESNYISGAGIVTLLEAINKPQTLRELRVMNQKPALLGNRVEMHIAELVRQNKSLVKMGINLEVAAARVALSEYVARNIDNLRRQRLGKELIELPAPREPKWLIRENVQKALLAGNSSSANGKPADEDEDEDDEEESSDEESDDEK